jgi:hypothetical protein
MGDLGQAEVGALAGVRGIRSSMVTALCAAAMRLIWISSCSLPYSGSMSKLMRSKLPSTLGVSSRPRIPPDSLIGPGVQALYADLRQALPQRFVGQGTEHRAALGAMMASG